MLSFLCYQSVVLARPQNNFGSFSTFADTARSSFSNFKPKSQIFSGGTNRQLSHQTFSINQDAFFKSFDSSLDNLFHTSGKESTGFNGLANTGFSSANGKSEHAPFNLVL